MKMKDIDEIEDYIKVHNIQFEDIAKLLGEITIPDNFIGKGLFSTLHPHTLLKPTQSALDLVAGAYEIGDNANDVNCMRLTYMFQAKDNGLVDLMVIDNGPGIKGKNIKDAVAYGGYMGPQPRHRSGKYLEGLSNTCGSFCEKTEVYTSDGTGWVHVTVDYGRVKEMINIFEEESYSLDDKKRDIYKAVAYKSISNELLSETRQVSIEEIQHLSNEIGKTGTIIIFRDCYEHIVDYKTLDFDIENLVQKLGRRYYNKIDNGTKVLIGKQATELEVVKSIDLKLASLECNYRAAFTTDFFILDKFIKVSELTGNPKDTDFIKAYVSIKKKTAKYADEKKKSNKKNEKCVVPKILKIGIDNQGLCIERVGIPLQDGMAVGFTRHPKYNGITIHIDVDSRIDELVFVSGDKSQLSAKKLEKIVGNKISNIMDQALEFKKGRQKNISYIDAEGMQQIVDFITINPSREEEPKEELKEELKEEPKEEPKKLETEASKKAQNMMCSQLAISALSNKQQSSIGLTSKELKDGVIEKNDQDSTLLKEDSRYQAGLVFAAKYKSKNRFDYESNSMMYEKRPDEYLIYNHIIDDQKGITIGDLERWWTANGTGHTTLEERMKDSISNKSEFQLRFFNVYINKIKPILKDQTPALLPEVELFHNSSTLAQDSTIEPQRIDFYMTGKNFKIIIEIDGIHHIADKQNNSWIASEKKYAKQCEFDNKWKIRGNEIYRISNKTLKDLGEDVDKYIERFLLSILKKHRLI